MLCVTLRRLVDYTKKIWMVLHVLIDFVRYEAGLTGAHIGCEEGICGACTIELDGKIVKSCLIFAAQADGASITTIEGLAQNGQLDAIQEAFIASYGLQCGYCTPGMIMSARALLRDNPSPSEEDIRSGMVGNLCRCTGYQNIIQSVTRAAEAIASGKER